MSMSTIFRRFRRVSTPLVAIRTVDARATIKTLADVRINGDDSEPPVVVWDLMKGHRPANEPGVQAAASIGNPDETANALPLMLRKAEQFPGGTILCVINAHEFIANAAVAQGIWNLRDEFKRDRRTLVLLAPDIKLPLSLQSDLFLLDDELPDDNQLQDIIGRVHTAAGLGIPEDLAAPVAALKGLGAFPAEEAVAHNLRSSGLNLDGLWEAKRRMINQTAGLSIWSGSESFKDIGGVDQVKGFLQRILHAKEPPNAIVFVDEIEKAMGGTDGDLSGVSMDALGTLLSYMQDQAASGCIFVGPPGSAKSMVAKATGAEGGLPTIALDLGALRGSLVGQSEAQLRAALQVITAASSGRTLWLATCNSFGSLKPELRRRFTLGTFYFDLPDQSERETIWQLYKSTYGLHDHTLPNDDSWTGSEIRQCADLAWRLDISLTEASQFVVPVANSAAEQIDELRAQADGRFLSASYPGVYRKKVNGSVRSISL